jgi:hypothetical protein
VNVARMESQGLPGRVQVSLATFEHHQGRYRARYRGSIEAKGHGEMGTYLLLGRRDEAACRSTDRPAGQDRLATRVAWPAVPQRVHTGRAPDIHSIRGWRRPTATYCGGRGDATATCSGSGLTSVASGRTMPRPHPTGSCARQPVRTAGRVTSAQRTRSFDGAGAERGTVRRMGRRGRVSSPAGSVERRGHD